MEEFQKGGMEGCIVQAFTEASDCGPVDDAEFPCRMSTRPALMLVNGRDCWSFEAATSRLGVPK